MSTARNQRRGILWAAAAAIGIAAFAIPWKLANATGSATSSTVLLLGWAAVFNSVFSVVQRRARPPLRLFDLGFAGVLAALALFGNLASATAIQTISPALLTVTQRVEVILVALLAWPLIGERIDRRFWIGVFVAGAGLVILQGPFEGADPRAVGIRWALLAAACFSAMAVLTRKYIARIDTLSVNGLRLWLSVLLWFLVYGVPTELFELDREQVVYTALAAFVGPFAGRLCMMNSARHLEARITTLATLAAPPLTLLLGYLLLEDLPSTREMLGGLLMLLGVAIPVLTWGIRRR